MEFGIPQFRLGLRRLFPLSPANLHTHTMHHDSLECTMWRSSTSEKGFLGFALPDGLNKVENSSVIAMEAEESAHQTCHA